MFKGWSFGNSYPGWIGDLCSFWVLRLLATELAVSSGSVKVMPRDCTCLKKSLQTLPAWINGRWVERLFFFSSTEVRCLPFLWQIILCAHLDWLTEVKCPNAWLPKMGYTVRTDLHSYIHMLLLGATDRHWSMGGWNRAEWGSLADIDSMTLSGLRPNLS